MVMNMNTPPQDIINPIVIVMRPRRPLPFTRVLLCTACVLFLPVPDLADVPGIHANITDYY